MGFFVWCVPRRFFYATFRALNPSRKFCKRNKPKVLFYGSVVFADHGSFFAVDEKPSRQLFYMPDRVTSVQADFFATGSSRLFCFMALLFLQTTARFLPLIKNQADSFFICQTALQAFKPTFSGIFRNLFKKQ